jgi:hypothetical protein
VINDSNDDDSDDDNIEYITYLIDKEKGYNLNGHEVVAAVTSNNGLFFLKEELWRKG